MNTTPLPLSKMQTSSGWFRTFQCKHATVLTAVTFVIGSVTGVMLFFHWGTGYVLGLHEWVGMGMVVAAVIHMMRHIKTLQTQLQKPRARIWLAMGVLVTALFVASAWMAPSGGNPVKGFARQSMDAPISAVGAVLGLSETEVQSRLQAAGLDGDALDMSVNDYAAFNHVKATTVLAAVMRSK